MVLSVRFQALTISKAPEYLQEGGPKGELRVSSFEFQVSSLEGVLPRYGAIACWERGRLARHSAIPNPKSSISPIAVVLVEFAVEGLAANAESAGGVSLVAMGVIERRFDRLTLNFVH